MVWKILSEEIGCMGGGGSASFQGWADVNELLSFVFSGDFRTSWLSLNVTKSYDLFIHIWHLS